MERHEQLKADDRSHLLSSSGNGVSLSESCYAPVITPNLNLSGVPSYNFTVPDRLSGDSSQWSFSRVQWFKLCHFMSRCYVLPGVSRVSILQLYLAYVRSNGGFRFHTEVPTAQHGNYLSHQLERFRLSLVAFAAITGSTKLVDKVAQRASVVSWGPAYGLPCLPRVLVNLFHPSMGYLSEDLGVISSQISALTMDANPGVECWRHVTWGVPDSQIQIGGTLPVVLLLSRVPRLVKGSVADWWHQAKACQRFVDAFSTHPASSALVGGVTIASYLRGEGVMSRYQLQSLRCTLARVVRRCEWLAPLNVTNNAAGHVSVSAGIACRSVCVKCLLSGPMKCSSVWLSRHCDGKPCDVESANLTLHELARITQERVRYIDLLRR
eukprot:6455851-Amphidinium_carterae.1